MIRNTVCASRVLSAEDLEMRKEQDLTEIVARFPAVGEGVVAHRVESAKGQGRPSFRHGTGDDHSGEFYVFAQNTGNEIV